MKVLSNRREPGTQRIVWTLYNGYTFKKYDAEDVPVAISDMLKMSKDAEHIYINNLNIFFFDIVSTLWRIGFTPIKGNPAVKKMHEHEFKYLVNDQMNVYSITLKHHKRATVIINYNNIMSIDNERVIDTWTDNYEGERNERLALAIYRSIKELNRDCCVEKSFPITISGYARRRWKNKVGYWDLMGRLPDANKIKVGSETLEQYCRKAYHGGLNLARGKALASDIIDLPGNVLDVNSLYPYIMRNCWVPVKTPFFFKGEPKPTDWREARKGYIYMYLRVKVSFRLKKDGIPCVQIPARDRQSFTHKRGWMETTQYYNYHTGEYMSENEEEPNMVELTLTQTDYELMLEHYDILKIEHISYLVFLTTKELFADYVDEYFNKKLQATTPGEKRIAKMMLNGLSGSMARLPEYTNILIDIDENGNISIEEQKSMGGQSYVYIGAAITSYARKYLIEHAKKCGSLWLYSDTDSVHLIGQNIPSFFKIGDGLGEWKIEKSWDKVIYYKAKMYGMIKDGETHLTLAGVPKDNVRFLERMINDPNEYSFEGLDITNPNEVFTDEEEPKDNKKFDVLENDIRELGLKALCYSSFPVTIRKHGKGEFEEILSTQYSNLSDKSLFT